MNKYITGVDINDWLSLWMPHENAKIVELSQFMMGVVYVNLWQKVIFIGL